MPARRVRVRPRPWSDTAPAGRRPPSPAAALVLLCAVHVRSTHGPLRDPVWHWSPRAIRSLHPSAFRHGDLLAPASGPRASITAAVSWQPVTARSKLCGQRRKHPPPFDRLRRGSASWQRRLASGSVGVAGTWIGWSRDRCLPTASSRAVGHAGRRCPDRAEAHGPLVAFVVVPRASAGSTGLSLVNGQETPMQFKTCFERYGGFKTTQQII